MNFESKASNNIDVETFMSPARNNSYSNALLSPLKPIHSTTAVSPILFSGEKNLDEKNFFRNSGESVIPNSVNNAKDSGVSNAAMYIESLEKALNKEQTHAQHLAQKNETLIKELEELKAR